MKLLDSIQVANERGSAIIELCHGDLTEMGAGAEVDFLVISALPDHYIPTRSTLIGALDQKGISVAEMARKKAVDLRAWCCCWMSCDITVSSTGLCFKRIFCFEPGGRGDPPALVEDLFRGLAPFLNDRQPSYVVAMPLLGAGMQGVPIPAILGAIIRTAHRWIKFGLPIRRLQIVEVSDLKVPWMLDEFTLVKRALEKEHQIGIAPARKGPRTIRHTIIYAPEDIEFRDELMKSLQTLRRQSTIEVWHEGLLLPGTDVDGEIGRHLKDDDVILLLMSPDFLASDRCMKQAEDALKRHKLREVRLIPVLVRPCTVNATHFGSIAPLPTDGRPAIEWPIRDQAWNNVAGGIRLLVAN